MRDETPEEALEASIWRAMSDAGVTCLKPIQFIVDMQLAARRYAAGDSEILTAARREVLHRDSGPQGQTSDSDCGGGGGTPPELHPSGSGTGRTPAAVGGATLSTGPDVPGAGKGSGKSHPQPVDKT